MSDNENIKLCKEFLEKQEVLFQSVVDFSRYFVE